LEFDWTGSHDPTAYLCVPEAIRFLGGLLPGGWPELMARNRQLALEARRILCDALDAMPPAPEEMVGALAAVPLPDGADAPHRSARRRTAPAARAGSRAASAAAAPGRSRTARTRAARPSPSSAAARSSAASAPAERGSALTKRRRTPPALTAAAARPASAPHA